MRWIKNFIGSLKGYSGCHKCGDAWNWKKEKCIPYSKGHFMFALCEECFNKASIDEIIWWYESLLNTYVKSRPIDYTPQKIKKIRQTLMDNIIKEKNKEG